MILKETIELSVTARNLEEIKVFAEAGADGFLIGNQEFAVNIDRGFSAVDLVTAIELAKSLGKKVYLLANALYHNAELAALTQYLSQAAKLGVDAVVFEDPAVYSLVTELGLNLPLHLSSGSMITSSGVINFWGSRGITRAEPAREISVDEILAVQSKSAIELGVQVYGRTPIFYSRRQLVSSYQEYINYEDRNPVKIDVGDQYLFLREEQRPEVEFPLIEDIHGTHVYSDQVIDLRDAFPVFLSAGIRNFKIDGIFMSTTKILEIIADIRQHIDWLSQDGGLV
ncbi:MAG: peptidase U32 family protein [Anaerovoracaceae bacterium]|jgi:putative protease